MNKNAKSIKKQTEKEISKSIKSFEKETGLEVYYIDVSKKQNIGFSVNKEELDVKIKLKE